MKTKHGLLFGFAVIAMAVIFTLTGCQTDSGETGQKPEPDKVYVGESNGSTYTLTIKPDGTYTLVIADGAGGSKKSTGTASESNGAFTLKPSTGGEGGTFTVTADSASGGIGNIQGEITFDDGSTQPPPEAITALISYSVTANGEKDKTDTTALSFVFSAAVSGLGASDITITPTGSVSIGALTGSGKNWSLAVTVNAAGTISVAIGKTGIATGTQSVTVHKKASGSGGVPSGNLGAALTITGEQVYTNSSTTGVNLTPVNWDKAVTVSYNGNVVPLTAPDKAEIKAGKLTVSIAAVDPAKLVDIRIMFNENWLGSSHDNLAAAPDTAKFVGIGELKTADGGFLGKTDVVGSPSNHTQEYVNYVYVDKDVTITGKGKNTASTANKPAITYTDINLVLKEGWNAICMKTSLNGTAGTITYSVGNPALKWVWDSGD